MGVGGGGGLLKGSGHGAFTNNFPPNRRQPEYTLTRKSQVLNISSI